MTSPRFFMDMIYQADIEGVDLHYLRDGELFPVTIKGGRFRYIPGEAIRQESIGVVMPKAAIFLDIKGTELRCRRCADSTAKVDRLRAKVRPSVVPPLDHAGMRGRVAPPPLRGG